MAKPQTDGLVQRVQVWHVDRTGREMREDAVAAEEPLQIRLQGTSFVVTMRTPGMDRELAAGFLLAERVIESARDLRSIQHCVETVDTGNVLDVMLTGAAADRAERVLAERRLVMTTSACGVCGRRSIDDLMEAVPRVASRVTVRAEVITTLPDTLRRAQAVFEATGGLHAAGLFTLEGALMASSEDVGRHNAVDKVIGAELLEDRVPLHDRMLFVSGRSSFEIIQKAVMAGVPIIAAVSAPSSLAIRLADEAGVTLIGFVRDGAFNVYTGRERVGA